MSGVVDLKLRTGSGLLRCGKYDVYLEGQGDLVSEDNKPDNNPRFPHYQPTY